MLRLMSARAQAVAFSVLRSGVAALKLSAYDQATNRELRYKTRSLPW